MGEYTCFLSDGVKEYLKYDINLEHGYVEVNNDSFVISNESFDSDSLFEVEKQTEVIMMDSAFERLMAPPDTIQEGYEYLSDLIPESFSDCKNYEVVILKKADKIYGAINSYKYTSGSSGYTLPYEYLDKSYLFDVVDGEIKITKRLNKTAVFAFNESHCIAYSNQKIYSINKENDEKIEICKDIWWDRGPTFYSYMSVHFVEDTFMLRGNKSKLKGEYATLIVGDISGERIETLIDNKKE